MKFVFYVCLGLIILALIIFPGFRGKLKVLISGFLNVFVEDAAKTPDGANAVFSQAIDEVQDKYNKASATLNRLSGELKHTESEISDITREIKDVEASCERLVKANQIKEAEIYASRRAELLAELKQKTECVTRLKPMVADATNIHEALARKLRDLKRNRKETVERLKMNGQLKDLLGDLDDLKKDTATEKMLGSVVDGSKELQKEVDGARVVHENRASTKLAKAEKKAEQLETDEYIMNLKKKYGGK